MIAIVLSALPEKETDGEYVLCTAGAQPHPPTILRNILSENILSLGTINPTDKLYE